MKYIFAFSFILFINIGIQAQEEKTIQLQTLYENEMYEEILDNHAPRAEDYPARAIYYVGMAYYMKADDNNCLKFMDMSIEKDSKDPDPYYIKGMTYNYMEMHKEAIKSFNKAIDLDNTNAHYHSGLGDAYYYLEKYDKALSAYKNSIETVDTPDRPYIMIPQIYSAQEKNEEALKAFYIAKDNIAKSTSSYVTVLYNIGLFEYLKGNYETAETIYLELLTFAPNDYTAYTKLIQVYYATKEYEKAIPYKEKLYEAYNGGLLEGNLSESFCFDQFKWKDKDVRVFERFASPQGKLYYKHVFYILNDKNDIEYHIQTENSVFSEEMGGPKYLLGMDKDKVHYTFYYGFPEDLNYDDLKAAVIKVLEGEVRPGSSSTRK